MSLSGTKVKLEDGTVINENWATWRFICKDGTFVDAKFTDTEIKDMMEKHPEIKWTDGTAAVGSNQTTVT